MNSPWAGGIGGQGSAEIVVFFVAVQFGHVQGYGQ